MKVGVLVSGSGTNLQALLDAQVRGDLSCARLSVVVSNVAEAYALKRAQAAGIPHAILEHGRFGKDRAAFEMELLQVLKEHEVQLVVLAGFLRLLGPTFLASFENRVLNIHPSLLPAFPGMHAQRQALAYGARISGCTVHLVDEGCDTGPIVLQAAVPVLPEDTEETLSARILKEEHRLYPLALRLFAEGRIERCGRMLKILGKITG